MGGSTALSVMLLAAMVPCADPMFTDLQVFEDSFHQLRNKDMRGKLVVHFQNEEGIDAGGVSREWFQVRAGNHAMQLLQARRCRRVQGACYTLSVGISDRESSTLLRQLSTCSLQSCTARLPGGLASMVRCNQSLCCKA